jgi:argininosuccinate lyase
VQNSRGQIELQVLACLAQSTLSLRRFAWDVSLFTCQEFGFASLSPQFTTGSSLMPNKSNPDTIELLRAQHSVVQGAMTEVQSLLSLPAGYHRDLQLTKGATIRAVENSLLALGLVPGVIAGLQFHAERMRAAISIDMYATDVALERVQKSGVPFREAYRTPISSEELAGRTPEASVAARISPGGCADLRLDELRERLAAI